MSQSPRDLFTGRRSMFWWLCLLALRSSSSNNYPCLRCLDFNTAPEIKTRKQQVKLCLVSPLEIASSTTE